MSAAPQPNVESAVIKGEMKMEGSGPVIVGTFRATWKEQTTDGCVANGCPSATITASFRSVFDF